MKKNNLKKIKGYIEGYYGKLLSWNERELILKELHKNSMNFYFYCPKEDIFHRKNWRKAYPKNWLQSFKNFCEKAKKLNIKIIVGISPGLDFDYNSYINGKKDEIKSLIKKLKLFYSNGATFTAILFDDIETKFKKEFQSQNEAKLMQKL